MSGCSGSGMLELVSAALVDAINNMVLEKDSLKMEVARFAAETAEIHVFQLDCLALAGSVIYVFNMRTAA